jgi:hypothetical protein
VEIEDTIPGVCLSTRFPAKVPRGVGLAPFDTVESLSSKALSLLAQRNAASRVWRPSYV